MSIAMSILEAATSVDAIRTLADLGMLGAVIIGGFGVWWVIRNSRNANGNSANGKLMEAFRQREAFIDRMLTQLGDQGRHLEQMVGEQRATNRTLQQLVDRIDHVLMRGGGKQ